MPVHGLVCLCVCVLIFCVGFVWSVCMHGACVLTQVTKQLHSQRCKDKEEEHEEKTQIPHLQRGNRKREGLEEGEMRLAKQTNNKGQQTAHTNEKINEAP